MRTVAGYGEVKIMAYYLADRFRDGGFAEEDINILPFTSPNGEEQLPQLQVSVTTALAKIRFCSLRIWML